MRTLMAMGVVIGSWTGAASAQQAEGDEPAPATESAEAAEANPEPESEAQAEDEADPGMSEAARESAVALARALERRLTVWERGNRRIYVWHCRSARVECRARVVAMAQLITQASWRHSVDPFLVAAMALRESGLNPFAEGSIGERGIVQLHPRGIGSRVRFVRSEAYRRRCERRPDACQGEVVDAGAEHVSAAIARCGSIPEGLGAYNTGVCQETGYSRRVLEERSNLLRLAKQAVSANDASLMN